MHKKKRISRSNPKDSSPIRTGFQSSKNQSNTAIVDQPKTSEYAFFKKLKTNAARRLNSHHLHEETEPNKFKSSDFSTERRSSIRNSSKEFRFPIEDGTRANHHLLRSPNGLNTASTSFQDICSSGKRMEEIITLRPRGQNENVEAFCSATWLNDVNFPQNQNMHEYLFSKKRQKLHQWVADISFPEIEKLCSKGYDFVSVLLRRLFPESSVESIPKSERLPSNNQLKELHRTSTGNLVEVECGPNLENGPSGCWLNNLGEGTLSSYYPVCHAHDLLLDYNQREPSIELRGKDKISWIKSDSDFSFPFQNYGHFPSVHIKELDDFHDLDCALLRRVQHPLLLERDSENVINQRTSLISQNSELITYPLSSTSLADDHEQSLLEFGQVGAAELYPPSVICKFSPNFYSLPPSHSTSYCEYDYGRQIFEDKEDRAADMNHYPSMLFALSHITSYPGPDEDCHDNHWFTREVLSERPYDPDTDAHFSSKLDFELGRECLPICKSSSKHFSSIRPDVQFPRKEGIFSHFLAENEYENHLDGLSSGGILNLNGQDKVNIHDRSSFYFQMPLDKEKPCPLLLDKSDRYASGGELYHEDGDIECL